jgi:hypothetical protein
MIRCPSSDYAVVQTTRQNRPCGPEQRSRDDERGGLDRAGALLGPAQAAVLDDEGAGRQARVVGEHAFVDVEKCAHGPVAVGVRADPPSTADHRLDERDHGAGIHHQHAAEGGVARVRLFRCPGLQPAVQA